MILKFKSKECFKTLVKKKALDLALRELNAVKETHSKLNNLVYPSLEMQKYLSSSYINPEDAKEIFSYRVRMANYGENFRGAGGAKGLHNV